MFERLKFWKEPEKEVNSNIAVNNVLSQPTQQDPIDMLIRKVVPEAYREKILGSIYDNDRNYYFLIVKRRNIYKIRIWYTPEDAFYCYIDLPERETCSFINGHFDELVKKIQDSVLECQREEQKANEEKIRYQMCQNTLHEKVITYCNQKV